MIREGKIIDKLKINDTEKLVQGELAIEMVSEHVDDPYSVTGTCQEIKIYGKATLSGPYVSNLLKIESDRYIISDITVTKEGFLSGKDTIDYVFTAGGLQVKY